MDLPVRQNVEKARVPPSLTLKKIFDLHGQPAFILIGPQRTFFIPDMEKSTGGNVLKIVRHIRVSLN